MSLPVTLFALLAGVTAASAVMVVLTAHIVRAAVWLLFTLLGVGGLFFLLGAEFVGATQLIVYVGGTMVLVVFGVMLTAQGPFLTLRPPVWERATAAVVALGLFAAAVAAITGRAWPEPPAPAPHAGVAELGQALTGTAPAGRASYLLPFEAASVHLVVVLIGAAYLARAKRRRRPDEHG
jgi:NADH-quinone oxidoreductase subunit J